jgi:hypothetical protein
MTTERLRQSLGASVSLLISERRRLEDECMDLEGKAKSMTQVDGDLVRKLRRQVDTDKAALAEKQRLLAEAEERTHVLARDAAEAQAAAHQEAVAQCKARLGALLDRELELVEHAERLARELLEVRKELLTTNAEARAEAGRLARQDVVSSESDLLKRMSLRESKMMSRLAGCTHRYGHLTLLSGSHGIVLDALTWAEDERRHQVSARDLASGKE